MKNGMQQSIDKTANPIEPLYDTWSFRYAGDNYWWINPPPFKFNSTLEINSWFATTAKNTLDAFFELARVWKVYSDMETRSCLRRVFENGCEDY